MGVNKKDLNFAFLGLDCEKKNGKIVTKFNPFIITRTQFIKLHENESDTPLIRRMKFESYARVFPTFKGRSGGADWLNTVGESQLAEMLRIRCDEKFITFNIFCSANTMLK